MTAIKMLWRDYGGFWRCVAIAAIIFESGISGSWLAAQMRDPLPYWWGFFGAVIQGLATFGGVNLAQRGRRIGWLVIAVSGGAGVVFSYVFFGEVHSWFVAGVLGIYPTGVAVLGGVVESSQQDLSKRDALEAEEREFKRQRLLKQDELRTQIKLEEVRTKIHEFPAPSVNVHVQNNSSVNVRELTSDEKAALDIISKALGDTFTSAQAEEVSPLGRTKTYEVLKLSQEHGILVKEERGKWRFK